MEVGSWEKCLEEEWAFWVSWFVKYRDEGYCSHPGPLQWGIGVPIILESIHHLSVPLTPVTKVLEIGGGIVGMTSYFPTGKLYACDPLWHHFEGLRPHLGKAYESVRHDINLLSLKAEDLPLRAGPFDIVIAINSLDHCSNPNRVLERIKATTRSRAVLYEATTVWKQQDKAVNPEQYSHGHPHIYFDDEWNELVTSCAFRPVSKPLLDRNLQEEWRRIHHVTDDSWPCDLRVWRRL